MLCCRCPVPAGAHLHDPNLAGEDAPGEEAPGFPSDAYVQKFGSLLSTFAVPCFNNLPVQLQQIQRFRIENVETAQSKC